MLASVCLVEVIVFEFDDPEISPYLDSLLVNLVCLFVCKCCGLVSEEDRVGMFLGSCLLGNGWIKTDQKVATENVKNN